MRYIFKIILIVLQLNLSAGADTKENKLSTCNPPPPPSHPYSLLIIKIQTHLRQTVFSKSGYKPLASLFYSAFCGDDCPERIQHL